MDTFPEKIEQVSDTVLRIDWSDGHQSLYFADHLRKHCPCALCEKDRSGDEGKFEARLNDKATDLKFNNIVKMGRYALEFHYNDGHAAGIYPYGLLLNLCQCDVCDGKVIRIQGPFS